jgi:hypothetical protein
MRFAGAPEALPGAVLAPMRHPLHTVHLRNPDVPKRTADDEVASGRDRCGWRPPTTHSPLLRTAIRGGSATRRPSRSRGRVASSPAVGDDCTNDFGTTLDTKLATIEQCLLREHGCSGETMLEAQVPPAKELLRVARLASNDVDALTCLPDHGGLGASLDAPNCAGKAVSRCASTLAKTGNGFVAKQLKSLAICVHAALVCVMEKPGDAVCARKARATCDKAFTTIDVVATAFTNAITKACAPPAVDFSDLSAAAGMNVGALASDCAALGVPSLAVPANYVTCLVRREICAAEDLLRFEVPRVTELLFMMGRPAKSLFCPAS